MSKPVDLELKKAFTELQTKMIETSKKIQVIETQIGILKKLSQHVNVTQREMEALPSDTKVYESVGRMFLLSDVEEIKANLHDKDSELAKRKTDLEKNKEFLEKNLKESEDNIREMVQQRKEQTDNKY